MNKKIVDMGKEKERKTEVGKAPEIVVLVGQSGAGKTTIAEVVNRDGIASCTILRQEVARRGLEDTHENIHVVAMELIAKDPAWQAKKALEMIKDGSLFIFDDPRSPTDLCYLRDSGRRVEIVGVYSSRAVRYQRVLDREEPGITKEQFMERCVHEVLEAGLNGCLSLATVYVFNNGQSLEQFRRDAVSLVKVLEHGNLPQIDFTSEGGMPGFEQFINVFPTPFTNSEKMCARMREYLEWEKEQLEGYRRGEIPLERFL